MKTTRNKLEKLISEAIDKEFANGILNAFKNHSPYRNPDSVEIFDDPKCFPKHEGDPYNRAFTLTSTDNRGEHKEMFYKSRSVVVSMKCFCKDRRGEWCLLANQRGNGTTNSGKWNTPCGYLDYGEDLKHGVARETFEETGVRIPIDRIEFLGEGSDPYGRRQDVSIRFKAILGGTIDNYPTSDKYCEPGEVSDIKWIPLSQLRKYGESFASSQMYHAEQALGNLLYQNHGRAIRKHLH